MAILRAFQHLLLSICILWVLVFHTANSQVKSPCEPCKMYDSVSNTVNCTEEKLLIACAKRFPNTRWCKDVVLALEEDDTCDNFGRAKSVGALPRLSQPLLWVYLTLNVVGLLCSF
ncbi:hypothetical protein BaRGS_00000943 [Batillaria attramentaria]|uniref:Uncharacterized protein n=1 Tax=Batillaria attramentaria TaxID=370345 RepID=A0ABD0M9R9_9CAEN